jgi:hypothetical protein
VGAVAASMHPEKIEASGSNVREACSEIMSTQFISLTDQELFTFIFRIYPQKGDAVVHTKSFLTQWKYPVFGRVPNTCGPCSSSFKKHFETFRCRAPLFDCTILALLRGWASALFECPQRQTLLSLLLCVRVAWPWQAHRSSQGVHAFPRHLHLSHVSPLVPVRTASPSNPTKDTQHEGRVTPSHTAPNWQIQGAHLPTGRLPTTLRLVRG